jgi:hypothetical protein
MESPYSVEERLTKLAEAIINLLDPPQSFACRPNLFPLDAKILDQALEGPGFSSKKGDALLDLESQNPGGRLPSELIEVATF